MLRGILAPMNCLRAFSFHTLIALVALELFFLFSWLVVVWWLCMGIDGMV
jgi:hypothetical protein